MYIRLRRGESTQNFNVWGIYDSNGPVRAGGLFINKSGLACYHHFLMPKGGGDYDFSAGEYLLQVYVELVDESPRKMFEQKVFLTNIQEEEMKTKKVGIQFDWTPNTQNYSSYVAASSRKNEEFTDLIRRMMDEK